MLIKRLKMTSTPKVLCENKETVKEKGSSGVPRSIMRALCRSFFERQCNAHMMPMPRKIPNREITKRKIIVFA